MKIGILLLMFVIWAWLILKWTGFGKHHIGFQRRFKPKISSTANTAIKSNKKPEWVKRKVIYLKALNPNLGCRKIAEMFNRLHLVKDAQTVSKSYVYLQLKTHQYQWRYLRKQIKQKRPAWVPINNCWGVDLTTVTDVNLVQQTLLAIVDYGSRRCLCLQPVSSKHSIVLLVHLFRVFVQFGLPKRIKTDNEAVFKSLLFRSTMKLIGVNQQFSDVACPWQKIAGANF